jgi:hypothetical protein
LGCCIAVTVHVVTEEDARTLAVLVEQAAHPEANADARARRTPDGWEVVPLWDQGPFSFATRLTELVSLVDDSPTTIDSLALDVGLFMIDEPHGPNGDRDEDGRYRLD